VVRSARRKTIALQVKEQQVIVRAPYQVSDAYIESLVQSKRDWISEKLLLSSQKTEKYAFVNGRNIVFYGANKQLAIFPSHKNSSWASVEGDSVKVYLANRYFSSDDSKQQLKVRTLIENLYKQETELFLDTHLEQYRHKIGLSYTSLKIRKYKSRWGSCNSRGELTFNSLLSMLPRWVMEYVIVHELCHLKHLNHSALFWRLVELHFDRTQAAKKWLKQNAHHLYW